MQVSMHAYCFNAKTFLIAVHECDCDDLADHPERRDMYLGEPANKWFRPLGEQDSVEYRAVREFQQINGVRSTDYQNRVFFVVVRGSWSEVENQIKRALKLASEPSINSMLDRSAQQDTYKFSPGEMLPSSLRRDDRSNRYENLSTIEKPERTGRISPYEEPLSQPYKPDRDRF